MPRHKNRRFATETSSSSSVTISIVDGPGPLVNSLQVERQGGSRRPRQSVKLSHAFLCFRLTATMPRLLAIIFNGTIAAGMVVLLHRWRKARLDVCYVVHPKRHSAHDAATG